MPQKTTKNTAIIVLAVATVALLVAVTVFVIKSVELKSTRLNTSKHTICFLGDSYSPKDYNYSEHGLSWLSSSHGQLYLLLGVFSRVEKDNLCRSGWQKVGLDDSFIANFWENALEDCPADFYDDYLVSSPNEDKDIKNYKCTKVPLTFLADEPTAWDGKRWFFSPRFASSCEPSQQHLIACTIYGESGFEVIYDKSGDIAWKYQLNFRTGWFRILHKVEGGNIWD